MEIPVAWPRCPEAAAFFARQMQDFAARHPQIKSLAERLHEQAGVNLLNLVDHWRLPASDQTAGELSACSLVETTMHGEAVWEHPLARFPRVRLSPKQAAPRLALIVEDIELFLNIQRFASGSETGSHRSDYQEAIVPLEAGEELAVARRHGSRAFSPSLEMGGSRWRRAGITGRLDQRPRDGAEADVIAATTQALHALIAEYGCARVTDEFFASERAYYMTRNAAARWQYEQQQRLGIGWANHDHHTYRSSRESFRALMQLFLALGFEMRERFYAGAEAGWGAQILEHPVSRVVIFADVDMAPDELDIDFATTDLPPRDTLGTIGLWCALHGSSIAGAGMHHLEAEFDFAQVRANLEAAGRAVMPPFTDLPMLKQAFTQPEMWSVDPARLDALQNAGRITPEQAAHFREHGAAGSHLEILQRWDGFKGFNKTGVSNIILATDARNTN